MIGREIIFAHAETVAAFGVHVQLDRFVCGPPLFVQADAVWREAEVVVGGSDDKHRRRVDGHYLNLESSGVRIHGCYEGGPAFRSVVKGEAGCDRFTAGESADYDSA